MRVYEAIARGLEDLGVRAAFGCAGEHADGLLPALGRARRITPVVTRHEQAASFMARGYAMYTNRLGVCFATAGPGAFNLFSGLAVALSDSYPVLAVSGCSRRQWHGWGALNETSGLRRTPDARRMFRATTKESFLLEDAADTCEVLEAAVNLAFAGRPGPVHIQVPEDLTGRGVEIENFAPVRLGTAPVLPDPARVEEVAAVLARAASEGRRTVALVGFGAVRSGAGPEIRRMIERFRIPLLTTPDGKGIVSERHPLAVGVLADSGHASAWQVFREADVVLCVGNSLNQHATFDFRENLFEDKLLIHVNISEAEFRKAYTPDYTLLSDARPAVAALVSALERRVGEVEGKADEVERKVGEAVRKAGEAARVEVLPGHDHETGHLTRAAGAIHPGELARAMGRLLPSGGVLLADAGAHQAWLAHYAVLEEGQNFRKGGSFGPPGGQVNGAIGVKTAQPERTVVVGCGDGRAALSGFELTTAVEYDISVIWVIFNERAYEPVGLRRPVSRGRSAPGESRHPDFASCARAYGADGYRADTLDEFETAFRAALASGRPTVIDARIARRAAPHHGSAPDGGPDGPDGTVEARPPDP